MSPEPNHVQDPSVSSVELQEQLSGDLTEALQRCSEQVDNGVHESVGPAIQQLSLPSLSSLGGLLGKLALASIGAAVSGLVQAKVAPELLAALAAIKLVNPAFDPEKVLAPINTLLGYLGVPPIKFTAATPAS